MTANSVSADHDPRAECDVVVAAHRWYLPDGGVKVGGIDRTIDYLLRRGRSLALLQHPLTTIPQSRDVSRRSSLVLLRDAEEKKLAEFSVWPAGNPWRWISEIIVSPRVVRRSISPGFFSMAADPLCGAAMLALRRSGWARKTVLHCTDYSRRRSRNPFLNMLYQQICSMNLRQSDLVLCVSRRMEDRFRRWVPAGNYMFFPNTPEVDACPRHPPSERRRKSLVVLGVSSGEMDLIALARGFSELVKQDADAALCVIGGGRGRSSLGSAIKAEGVDERVMWHGFMERSAALDTMAKCGIGIVFYNSDLPSNYYRDSLKIREYAACGLPTVCDDSTSTAQEAQEAGAAIIVKDARGAAAAVSRLFADDALYEEMSRAAVSWARRNDKLRFLQALERQFEGLDGE